MIKCGTANLVALDVSLTGAWGLSCECPLTLSYIVTTCNSLPNYKILDLYKLKAFADDKINEVIKLKFDLESVENILGKR